MTLELRRQGLVEDDLVFFAMPYELKQLPDGRTENFDVLYEGHFKDWLSNWGLRAERADRVCGTTESVLGVSWSGIDRAGIVVADLSVPSTSVAMELAWALCLKKRLVVIAHEGAEVPTNVRGQLRVVRWEWSFKGLADLRTRLHAELHDVRWQRREPEMDLRPCAPASLWATASTEEILQGGTRVRDLCDMRRSAEHHASDKGSPNLVPLGTSHGLAGTGTFGSFFYQDNVLVLTQQKDTDPWDVWERTYQRGSSFTATVCEINSKGVWVALPGGGHSRVRDDEAEGLQEHDEVPVVIRCVDRARRRIDIACASRSAASATATPFRPRRDSSPRADTPTLQSTTAQERSSLHVVRLSPAGAVPTTLPTADDTRPPRS
ncbi:hypothetical protein ACFW3D_28415 [Streptomyces sp. NPDC058864]